MFLPAKYHAHEHSMRLNSHPILYQGKSFYLSGFGAFAAIGAFLGSGAFVTLLYSKGIVFDYHIGLWLMLVILAMIVCSKLLHPFVIGKDFLKSPFMFLKKDAFYNQGGQLGVLMGLLIISHFEQHNFFVLADGVAYGFCLALIFGRLGCYNYGCCYGKITQKKFAISYTHPDSKVLKLHPELYNVPLIPTQLIFAAFDTVMLIILTIIYFTNTHDGLMALIFFTAYNGFRIYIHQFNANETKQNEKEDCKLFLGLSILFTSIGALSLVTALFYYNFLPKTTIVQSLCLNLYCKQVFLNYHNLTLILLTTVIVFSVYGYHHLSISERFSSRFISK